MGELLSQDEQDWLLERLAELIARRGYESFVAAPILEPSDRYFPDAFSRDERGVYVVARRLLMYAGIGELDVHVEIFAELDRADETLGVGTSYHRGAAAWFAGIEAGCCSFGTNLTLLSDVERLPAALAHEVAHAFRAQAELQAADVREEELLTDLTTIYLGFGVLTTNASYRYRSSGGIYELHEVTRWTHQSLGYLPPPAMSFLLAAQATVRGMGFLERRRLASLLEPNQAAYFRSAARRLAGRRDELLRRLVIPARERWPAPPLLADLLRPIPAPPEAPEPPPLRSEPEPREANAGLDVYRVRAAHTGFGALIGFLAGSPVAVIAGGRLASWPAMLGILAMGLLLGRLVGRSFRADYCSDPACGWRIGRNAQRCPGCGGTIAGETDRPEDRFEREERLRRRARDG
jgi:hypothetical protein